MTAYDLFDDIGDGDGDGDDAYYYILQIIFGVVGFIICAIIYKVIH